MKQRQGYIYREKGTDREQEQEKNRDEKNKEGE